MRPQKSYNGKLMDVGTKNEDIILNWLKSYGKTVIDFREFRLAQRIDVDFGIETINGNIVLAEIKSDQHIKKTGNLCFEQYRINHFVDDKWFYLGWGWRSPAQKLIVRNPESCETFVYGFFNLRKFLGKYVAQTGKKLRTIIIETDDQKTTFCLLVPMKEIEHLYKKYIVKI